MRHSAYQRCPDRDPAQQVGVQGNADDYRRYARLARTEQHLEEVVSAGDFYWMVEGSIPTKPEEATSIAGETAAARAKRIYPKAKGTIAVLVKRALASVAASPNPMFTPCPASGWIT